MTLLIDQSTGTQKRTFKDVIFSFNGFCKLPSCSGYEYWTDCGYEYDCQAEHEETCEYCLCCYAIGGTINPETGKEEKGIKAFFKYGFRKWWQENF